MLAPVAQSCSATVDLVVRTDERGDTDVIGGVMRGGVAVHTSDPGAVMLFATCADAAFTRPGKTMRPDR